jgi:alpha-galactosidase
MRSSVSPGSTSFASAGQSGAECWARPLAPAGGAPAVAALFLNRGPLGSAPVNVTCSWAELGLPAAAAAAARDLYAHADLGAFAGAISLSVPPHASRLVKLVVQQ